MILDKVTDVLLTQNKITHSDLFSALASVNNYNIHYSDIYIQLSYYERLVMENNIIKHSNYSIDNGIGIRVIRNNKTGFAYANQINNNILQKSIILARDITDQYGNFKVKILTPQNIQHNIYSHDNPLSSLNMDDKILLLHDINHTARNMDRRVKEVIIALSSSYEYILIATSDGILTADIRPLVNLSINIQVEQDNKIEWGSNSNSKRTDYKYFLGKNICMHDLIYNALKIALVNLSAVPAPAGTMPVVLGSGWPGVLLHEAVGHGLESDFNRQGSSVFSNKLNTLVVSKLCTIVDDGTLKDSRGSLIIDDEGTPSQYNVLIKNGYLIKYMQDKLNAKLMGLHPTGNARRESYAHLPIPRMTNTYMLPGNINTQDIIKSVDYGIYAVNFSGGQVDITSGKFVFSTSEAYLIKNGYINKPIKNATLIGSGIEIMNKISMVGDDLKIDSGIGLCSKNGQTIPVTVGQPTIKIDQMVVGGTKIK
ncbi:MAG: metalloprotease TldD [Candidatus Lightella neohaematopini]|nr:metalloprotease TldD [Candidatus Lightella neohaematopini]